MVARNDPVKGYNVLVLLITMKLIEKSQDMNLVRNVVIITFSFLLGIVSVIPLAIAADPCYLNVSQTGAQQEILDSDCDGIPDAACADCSPSYAADNCPYIPNAQNRGMCTKGTKIGELCTYHVECGFLGFCSKNQEDADADGVGDACDYCLGKGQFDLDGDTICDGEDNCPAVPNPAQNDNVCLNNIEKFAPVGVFTGSWFEIGQKVSWAYADFIISFSNTFKSIMPYLSPEHGWTAQKYYNEIKDLLPVSITDHLHGTAQGLADVRPMSYETAWDVVITLNMATELINMKNNMSTIPEAPDDLIRGCTGFAVSSAAGTFLGHNTDAMGDVNSSVIMYFQPVTGDYAYMTMDPPGWADVGFGLNEKGIAVTTNAGNPNLNAAIGLPPNMMLRMVMEQAATLEEAVELFEHHLHSGKNFGTGGAILHIVDFNQSKMAKIQLRSKALEITYGEDSPFGVRYIGSANHFVGDFNPDPDYDPYTAYKSSALRFERVMELLQHIHPFDQDGCWTVLRDTSGGEANNYTISRTGGFGQSSTQFGTVFTQDGLYYAIKPPHLYFAEYPEPPFLSFPLPTSDRLVYFSATPRFRKVILRWKTLAADDAREFNLYRMEAKGGKAVKLDSSRIMPTGTNSYEYIDTEVTNRKTYYYKLERVAADGTRAVLDIVSVTPRLLFWVKQ